MELKEMFEEEIERQYEQVIAPKEDKVNIPSYEGDSNTERFFGDDEPAF